MPCYRPQPAILFKKSDGSGWNKPRIVYPAARAPDGARAYPSYVPLGTNEYKECNLPCGICFGCRMDNSRMWSLRIMHEARFSASSYFVTLTYAPEHMPLAGNLNYRHLQDFWKRARHMFQGSVPFRYFACGEYGDKSLRPHYHYAAFDWNLDDLRHFKSTPTGDYYLSDALAACWGYGHVIVAPLEWDSASYIARYVTKKMHGSNRRYLPEEYHDPVTGEVPFYQVERAFQSKGLGLDWYEKYKNEVWDLDACLYNNKYLIKPPRYYFKQLEKSDPDRALLIKEKRIEKNPHIHIDFDTDRELLYQMEARRLQLQSLKRELI